MKTNRGSLFLSLVFFLSPWLQAQKFLPDDPLWKEPIIPIPKPAEIERSQIIDYLSCSLKGPGSQIPRAQNINTLGEVPDSMWFTNRMTTRDLTIEELVRGPNQSEGPDATRPWRVTAGKNEGVSVGFTIRDSRGDTYFVKLDPLEHPQLATSTEIIATKFLHAFGYNVPENYLAYVARENLQLDPEAVAEGKISREAFEAMLEQAFWRPDGTVQVIASKALSGEPIGPFRYSGTRSDDPNDIIEHQDRRELRALYVFAAWLNHGDVRGINTLDTFIGEKERGRVKHHLIDFGYCLASGTWRPKIKRAGYEHMFELVPTLRSAFSLGVWSRPWRKVDFKDYPVSGHLEADLFHPDDWKPEYSNPAFQRLRPEDALWATRTLMRFTPEKIRAVVKTGEIEDREAEEYLVTTLIQRQEKIIRHYLSLLNPLHHFRVQGNALHFANLGVEAGLARFSDYRFQWFDFDNQSERLNPLGQAQTSMEENIAIPASGSDYLMVRIHSRTPSQPHWDRAVDVYLRNGTRKMVLGIEREE